MSASRFYDIDVNVLEEYRGLKAGSKVVYQYPFGTVPTRHPGQIFTVTELIRFGTDLDNGHVSAILDDGEWEVSADNLADARLADLLDNQAKIDLARDKLFRSRELLTEVQALLWEVEDADR